jgi:transposase
MASPPSHVQALLPDPSCLKLNSVEHQDGGRVLIAAAAFGSVAYCPACHHASHSLHSRYSRALHDLPWQGSTVGLRLDVRRFRCRTHDCPGVTFAETLPAVSSKYGRQTSRLSETVRLIGYVLGGEAGARLLMRLGMATSSDTVLRRLKVGPSIEIRGARALGVDDWAWRKGQRYGTILVDLETHTPLIYCRTVPPIAWLLGCNCTLVRKSSAVIGAVSMPTAPPVVRRKLFKWPIVSICIAI